MKIFDIKIDNVSMIEAIQKIKNWIENPQPSCRIVATVNPEMLMAAKNNSALKNVLVNADLKVPEATGIFLVSKIMGGNISTKVPGVDLVSNLIQAGLPHKWRWYFIGGAPGVAKLAADKLYSKYPDLIIVGSEDGGQIKLDNLEEQETLVNRINHAKADILLVAFGVPKQELFLDYFKTKLNIKVGIGVGGTLDFFSDKQKRAPHLISIIGLEWLWRLIREPSRFKRIWTAVVLFPLAVLRGK